MSESIYRYLERNKKPRVHISYEVETEHGIQEKELPFVVGVLGDFAADNKERLPPLIEREFMDIDRDNFNQVMEKISPKLLMEVDNKLNNHQQKIPLQLNFKSLKDFEPDQIVEQIEPLRKLKLARDRLRDLLHKAESTESLEKSLETILQDQEQLLALAKQLQLLP